MFSKTPVPWIENHLLWGMPPGLRFASIMNQDRNRICKFCIMKPHSISYQKQMFLYLMIEVLLA